MNKLTKITIASGAFGLIATIAVSSGALKASFKTIALSTLLAFPIVVTNQFLADGRAEKRVKKAQKELERVQEDNRKLQAIAKENAQLSDCLNGLGLELTSLKSQLTESTTTNQDLVSKVQALSVSLTSLKADNQKLIEQLTEYEESYSESLEAEVEQGIQAYKDQHKQQLEDKYSKALQEAMLITTQAMEISQNYEQWAERVADRHVERKAYITGLTRQFNTAIGEAEDSWDVEKNELIKQIELLQEKVGRLQQRVNADLVEPIYGNFGYAVEGKISNDIAAGIWKDLGIPLEVKGYRSLPNGSIEAGYSYSRSTPVEALIRDLSRHSVHLAKWLGIHEITSIKKLEIADLIVILFRREPAIKQDDLKRLLTPIEKLATQVVREMSRKSTIRIMGATGDGKGIMARYLLSYIIQLQQWIIRLHDPQHGSAEDYWGIPKVSKSGSEMKKALAAISNQMTNREVTKLHFPVTLDVLDEIDTQLEREDKAQFLNLISRIRHLGMKLILIGQNPKVSRAGFQWSDMAQMICFYQGSSALDAIKNNPALELKKDILLKQYNEISSVFQSKNEWLDDAKKHYFGLCVIPGKNPQWYELPIADEIVIDASNKLLAKEFKVTDSNSVFIESQNAGKLGTTATAQQDVKPATANAKNLCTEGIAAIETETTVNHHVGGNVPAVHTLIAACKKHPDVELRQRKDGRYYCPGCKKKLRKDELTWV